VYRPDGSYAVARRGGEPAKVFDGLAELRALYRRLPDRFTASDVDGASVSGSRRQLLVRHLAEHPAFDCTLVRQNPLTAEKRG
jgi:hypothetical protein